MLTYQKRYLLFFTILGFVLPAWAQKDDALVFRAGVTGSVDDNFFRAASSTVSERITSQSIGVNLSIPVSLQNIQVDASLTSNQHQTNSSFDYVAQNYNAAWQWSLTPKLHGSVSSYRTESLNPTNDSLNPTLRNKNTTQSTALSAAFDLGGSWQVTGGASSSIATNERAVIGQLDNQSSAINAGLRYALASGNVLAYSMRSAVGSSGNDYRSNTHEITSNWIIGGSTAINSRLAYLEQHFGQAPQFDFDGWSGAIAGNWRATGKLSLKGGWQRDINAYPSLGSTYTQTDALTLGSNLQLSSKTSLDLQYRSSVRDDQGSPNGTSVARRDRTQDATLRFNWNPRPATRLGLSVVRVAGNNTMTDTDFIANQISLSAQFQF